MAYHEIPVTFTNEGMRIEGMLHRPGPAQKPPGVVLFHGCTGSRTEAHWLFVKISRALAEQGIISLRFDFRFSGESEGRFEDMTLSGEVSDALRAMDFFTGECGADPQRSGVLGLSMGGAVAAIAAGRLGERVRSCVLLNPVARPIEDLAFIASTRKVDVQSFPIEFNSFLFGRAFFDDLPNIRPLEEIAAACCPTLIVNGAADSTVQPRRSKEYMDVLCAASVRAEHHTVDGGDHTFSSVKWEREVIGKTAEWFERTLK